MLAKLRRILFGAPKDVTDPHAFHQVSLVALLAWVGLGADGLSSSAYGPDEAFSPARRAHRARRLARAGDGDDRLHHQLRVLAASSSSSPRAAAATSSRPSSWASAWGVLSGRGAPRRLRPDHHRLDRLGRRRHLQLPAAAWSALASSRVAGRCPSLAAHHDEHARRQGVGHDAAPDLHRLPGHARLLARRDHRTATSATSRRVTREVTTSIGKTVTGLGLAGTFKLFVRAYSLGGGTYTGIEAVSNGVGIMREPRVQTAKRTMVLMALVARHHRRRHPHLLPARPRCTASRTRR